MLNKKNGFSLVGLILVIGLLGVGGIFGFQIGLGYLNKNTIQKGMRLVLENKRDGMTTREVRDEIAKRISLDNINISEKDFTVTDLGGGFEVSVNYTKTVRINQDIALVMDFDITESSK